MFPQLSLDALRCEKHQGRQKKLLKKLIGAFANCSASEDSYGQQQLRSKAGSTGSVIGVQKAQHFKAVAADKPPLDSDMIAGSKRLKTLPV